MCVCVCEGGSGVKNFRKISDPWRLLRRHPKFSDPLPLHHSTSPHTFNDQSLEVKLLRKSEISKINLVAECPRGPGGLWIPHPGQNFVPNWPIRAWGGPGVSPLPPGRTFSTGGFRFSTGWSVENVIEFDVPSRLGGTFFDGGHWLSIRWEIGS